MHKITFTRRAAFKNDILRVTSGGEKKDAALKCHHVGQVTCLTRRCAQASLKPPAPGCNRPPPPSDLPPRRLAPPLSHPCTFLSRPACDSQCLTCDTAAECTSCRDPTRVLLFGECQYDACAHQYYLNTTTRVCRGTWPS